MSYERWNAKVVDFERDETIQFYRLQTPLGEEVYSETDTVSVAVLNRAVTALELDSETTCVHLMPPTFAQLQADNPIEAFHEDLQRACHQLSISSDALDGALQSKNYRAIANAYRVIAEAAFAQVPKHKAAFENSSRVLGGDAKATREMALREALCKLIGLACSAVYMGWESNPYAYKWACASSAVRLRNILDHDREL